MTENTLDIAERIRLKLLYGNLRRISSETCSYDDVVKLRKIISEAYEGNMFHRDRFGFHPILLSLDTANSMCESLGADREMLLSTVIFRLLQENVLTLEQVKDNWSDEIVSIVNGLIKVHSLYRNQGIIGTENFRNLMLTFAADIRVIIIMIIDRLALMKSLNHHPMEALVKEVAVEAGRLYAPLAHMLGLYKIKGELEDLSLKYTNRDMYTRIARKLNETKKHRDAYIAEFIKPVKEVLEREGLRFDIKGRTKSIYSIWNKMVKQHTDVENIYDLFAIRIILDVAPEREHSECWLAYSLVTNLYQPNPSRLKDWLSVPKSNGYESLHTTVFGPQGKMVEVQIRSRRMDEIAEKGVAAHWKYKGVKSEKYIDDLMTRVREILENTDSGPLASMRELKLEVFDKEVYVFTPKGDLYKLPMGATLLDFAFAIHSKVGSGCVGGRVNGKGCKINYVLKSGDTVEILTSPNQVPKQDWLSIVTTSKARNKIRQTINEIQNRAAELAKEKLQRRFKNRKIEIDEAIMMKLIKKLGFKTVTDFYNGIASETLDVNDVIAQYELLDIKETPVEKTSAEEFTMQTQSGDEGSGNDVFVIGDNVKGINYRLSKCCNPVHGDDVFGFVSAEGVVKIHRENCPNASHIKARYPYRLISTRWAGRSGNQFVSTIRVVGQDDIGIVTNITSIISKENKASLRNISIDSHDGIFHGYLVVGVESTEVLTHLIKKILTVKGVKDVQRGN